DGTNINAGCGALHPEGLQKRLRAVRADVGFAFDGDGDRLISVDHIGEIRDGDYALAIAGRHMAQQRRLKGNLVVTTVMANLGLGARVGVFESEMNGIGRVLIRYSGTEALARVMIEGADAARIQAMADELAGVIRSQIGA